MPPSNRVCLRRSPSTPASSASPHPDQSQVEHIINEVVSRLQLALQIAASVSSLPINSPSAHQRTTPPSPASIPLPTTPSSTSTSQKRHSAGLSGSIPVPTPYVFPSDLPSRATPGSPSTRHRPGQPEENDCASVLEELRLAAVNCRKKLTIAREDLENGERGLRRARRVYEHAVMQEKNHGREAVGTRTAAWSLKAGKGSGATPNAEQHAPGSAALLAGRFSTGDVHDTQDHEALHTATTTTTTTTRDQGGFESASSEEANRLQRGTKPTHTGNPAHYPKDVPGARSNVAHTSPHVIAVLEDSVRCAERIHELARAVRPGQDFFSATPSEYLEIALGRIMSALVGRSRI
ncbi:hypothetical protein PENSPDRAFT_725098 [Peniophora sp. CONT]|nr:hypothetical protein PENSPDRAFT_725098 [Peniophora sp. CONT]